MQDNTMLNIEALYKSFKHIKVLDGIDLSLNKGDILAVTGPSGTGKSTLLRCINYLEKPDSGKISICDKTIDANNHSKQDIYEIRKKSAMVFQNFNLFLHKNVLENVMLPLCISKKMPKSEAKDLACEQLEKVGMSDFLEKYPITLSGGQQQRVAIARSLVMRPELLLFDEPTSSLDPQWVQEVLEVIRGLAEDNYTMLIVTHEIEFAVDVSKKMLFMDEGKILAMDSPKNLISNTNPTIKNFFSSIKI